MCTWCYFLHMGPQLHIHSEGWALVTITLPAYGAVVERAVVKRLAHLTQDQMESGSNPAKEQHFRVSETVFSITF